MNKTLALIAAAAGVAFAAPSFAEESASVKTETKVEKNDDGSVEKKATMTEKHKDAAGTKTTAETTIKEETDKHGNHKKTVKTAKTHDPKGLLNKTKTKTEETVATKDGVTKHTKKVDGKVVEDTTEASPAAGEPAEQ